MKEAINREDLYLFQTGKAQKAYLTFGCHYQKETKTYRFTVWAPNAKSVSVVGDFNFWNPLAHPMEQGLRRVTYINIMSKDMMENAVIKVIHLHFIQNADQRQPQKYGISMILNGQIKDLLIRERKNRRWISQCLFMRSILGHGECRKEKTGNFIHIVKSQIC